MIEPMNRHYSMTNPASVYNEEALTSLELAARTASKVNECVEAFNEHEKETDVKLLEQTQYIDNMNNVVMPKKVKAEVQKQIDDGTFDSQIDKNIKDFTDEYMGKMEDLTKSINDTHYTMYSELNEIFQNTTAGSTTLDAEIYDARVSYKAGVQNFPKIGDNIRSLGAELKEIRSGAYNIFHDLSWTKDSYISSKGLITVGSGSTVTPWMTAHRVFRKGDTVMYKLHGTKNSCVLATGVNGQCISGLVNGLNESDGGTPNIGFYTVTKDVEELFFMTHGAIEFFESYIKVGHASEIPMDWHMDFISNKGEYGNDGSRLYAYSDPIRLPAMSRITASLQAPPGVSTITLCDASGTIITPVTNGINANARVNYVYYTNVECYVRLCTRVNADVTGETTLKDVVYEIKPISECGKYRTTSFSVGNGHIKLDGTITGDGVYKYTNVIRLHPGETIRFYSAGSSSISALSHWTLVDGTYQFVESLVDGDNRYRHTEYTNTSDRPMWVRVCGKVVSSSANECVVTEAEIKDVIMYYKDVYYADVKNHPLYGKTISMLGDSLAYGNKIGPDGVWLHELALKYNMTEYNDGVNGLAITYIENTTAGYLEKLNTLSSHYTSSDYVVVIGGANDYRLNAPVGTSTDESETTFCGAIKKLLSGIRSYNPKAKILFMTNMNRFQTINEKVYVDKMIEMCNMLGVKCFNNYTDLGLYFGDANVRAWADEGVILSKEYTGTLDDATNNRHLSREAYMWVLPTYEKLLTNL